MVGGDEARYKESLNAVNCLFWTQYSYLSLNPHGLGDCVRTDYASEVCTVWSKAHWNHGMQLSKGSGGAPFLWGPTACFDASDQYTCPFPGNDNGTFAPTAACSAFPFMRDESLQAMRHMYTAYGRASLW